METKWTKGPWTVGNKVERTVYSPNQVYAPNGDAIASVYGIYLHRTLDEIDQDPRCSDGLAVAHLISSAPELYEALASFPDRFDYPSAESFSVECDKWFSGQVIPAMSKARGESKESGG